MINALYSAFGVGVDLLEELRLNGVEKPEQARLARLERSGEISVIPKAM